MLDQSAFSKVLVCLDFDTATTIKPIRCPISGKIIVSGADETPPRWKKIPTVLFYFFEGGDIEYIRPDLQAIIDEKRARLRGDEIAKLRAQGEEIDEADYDDGLSNFEIIEGHVESFGRTPLILKITFDEDDWQPIYVGLDLATTPLL